MQRAIIRHGSIQFQAGQGIRHHGQGLAPVHGQAAAGFDVELVHRDGGRHGYVVGRQNGDHPVVIVRGGTGGHPTCAVEGLPDTGIAPIAAGLGAIGSHLRINVNIGQAGLAIAVSGGDSHVGFRGVILGIDGGHAAHQGFDVFHAGGAKGGVAIPIPGHIGGGAGKRDHRAAVRRDSVAIRIFGSGVGIEGHAGKRGGGGETHHVMVEGGGGYIGRGGGLHQQIIGGGGTAEGQPAYRHRFARTGGGIREQPAGAAGVQGHIAGVASRHAGQGGTAQIQGGGAGAIGGFIVGGDAGNGDGFIGDDVGIRGRIGKDEGVIGNHRGIHRERAGREGIGVGILYRRTRGAVEIQGAREG